ncbi:hypothetical protein MASR1M32_02500 [Rhodobacter sp.]
MPPLTAVLGVDYDMPGMGLKLNATTTLARPVLALKSTNFAPPGYGVVDVGASWTFAENAVLNLRVNNVFDKKYYDLASASSVAPSGVPNPTLNTVPPELFTGPGRSIALNLDYKF